MQLATYQRTMDELEQLGVYVIGATIEDRDTAARMAEEEGITFPMAYGVTQESIGPLAPLWGEEKGYGHRRAHGIPGAAWVCDRLDVRLGPGRADGRHPAYPFHQAPGEITAEGLTQHGCITRTLIGLLEK